jgi:sugar phosphate permease
LSSARYRWVILACCILAYATSHLTRWSYTSLAPYISADLHLDKAALGLLGAAFFYPYALAQIPWGRLADALGGRYVISLGALAVAGLLVGFSTAESLGEAVGWRIGIGIAAACGFVPIASLLARWFGPQERGMANGAYYGLGGGLGEAAAFLLLPAIQIYFLKESGLPLSGWRGALDVIAVLIGAIGLLCVVSLRSEPPRKAQEPHPLDASLQLSTGRQPGMLRDPVLWLLGCYFAAGIIALRLIPGWLIIYASDVYRLQWGYAQDAAVLAGGMIGMVYVLGHVGGSPMIGLLSDHLLARGISRAAVATVGLAASALAFGLLTVPMPSPLIFGGVALLIGVALHMFPLINAAAAERWGAQQAGESLGWINFVGQLAGAVSLSVSGYLGVKLAGQPGNPLAEYVGIWSLGAASCVLGAIAGWVAHRRMTYGS